MTQLQLASSGQDAIVSHGDDFAVGKAFTGSRRERRSVLLAFAPVPVPGRCLLAAHVILQARSGADSGPVRIYPSAARSIASGHAPPPSSGGPGTLLDNQPAADPEPAVDGEQRFDVTEMLRLWADGGPFPSTQRSFETGAPVVLNLRPPDLTDGSYNVTYADMSPRLVIETRTDCS